MQSMASSRVAVSGQIRAAVKPSRAVQRRAVIVQAAEVTDKPAPTTSATDAKLAYPEWIPAQAAPVLDFFTQEDFSVTDNELYKKYVKVYAENEYVALCTGFKPIPETINGRAAMLGFLAAAGAEICGSGSFLAQLSKTPQPFLAVLALTVAASVIPIVKGTKGEYLQSLRETYTLPEGVFTEVMEKFHGRLAMVGLAGLLAIELLKGTPLL